MIEQVNITLEDEKDTRGVCWFCDVPDDDCVFCVDGKFDLNN